MAISLTGRTCSLIHLGRDAGVDGWRSEPRFKSSLGWQPRGRPPQAACHLPARQQPHCRVSSPHLPLGRTAAVSPGVARLASLGQNHSLWAISSAPAKVASPGLRAPHLHCRHSLWPTRGSVRSALRGRACPFPAGHPDGLVLRGAASLPCAGGRGWVKRRVEKLQ